MKSPVRFVIAVTICLSGWGLAPFVELPHTAFGWENYADAYNLIHRSIIPAAAVASGAEGAFFQTDVDINNSDNGGEALYEMWWLPRGRDNPSPRKSQIYSLGGGQSVRVENVLSEVFGLQPDRVGAVVIASDSDGLSAMSRTYNLSGAGTTGSFGQAMPAVPDGELIQDAETRRIIFFSENTGARGNLGCVNGTDSEVEILIDLYDSRGNRLETREMILGPWANNQLNRVFLNHQPIEGYVELTSSTPGASYFCYGSVLDNPTSDPTTILPQRPSSGTTYYIPAAALTSGAAGAFFQTDVDVNNVGAASTFTFTWLPRGEDNSEPIRSVPISLGAGMSARFENVLSRVFFLSPDSVGALGIQSQSEDLVAMSRTYNVPGDGGQGTFGQALPGVQEGDLIRAGERKRIIFLSENGELRSNVGCVNASDEDIDIDIDIFDDTGTLRGRRELELEAWSNDQINRILQPYAPTNGYVEVSTDDSGARFYCYGSVLDNRTSDPTTIAPQ